MRTEAIKKAIKFLESLLPKEEGLDKTEAVETAINEAFKVSINTYLLEREIKAIVFNAKYTDKLKDVDPTSTKPYDLLTTFYSKANKGDSSFKKEPFFRLLTREKDIETKKLQYRLNRQ